MPNILNPSFGELCDRMTILNLKLGHASGAPVDVVRVWAEELQAVTYAMEERNVYVNGFLPAKEQEAFDTLVAVNRALWDAEDRVRDLPDLNTFNEAQPKVLFELACLAKQIAAANDKRAACIRALNQFGGDNPARYGKIFNGELQVA